MRNDLRHILHPNDSSSYPTTATTITTTTTTTTNTTNTTTSPTTKITSGLPSASSSSTSSNSTGTTHYISGPRPAHSTPSSVPASAVPIARVSPTIPESTPFLFHHILHHDAHPDPVYQQPHLHRRPSSTSAQPPSASNSLWSAVNFQPSPASLPHPHSSGGRGPATQASSTTRPPSSQMSPRRSSSPRDSSAHSASSSNLDQSATYSTVKSESSLQPTREPTTTPPSPSPSPVHQPGMVKTSAAVYQSTATQTSFSGSPMGASQLQEPPNSSQTVKQFSPDPVSSHIYPSPHAESSPEHPSPVNIVPSVSPRHPIERLNPLVAGSPDIVAATLPRPGTSVSPNPAMNGRTSLVAWAEETHSPQPSASATPGMCSRCAKLRSDLKTLSDTRRPLNMAASLGKQAQLSDIWRDLNKPCENCQRMQSEPSANGTGIDVVHPTQVSPATFDIEEINSKGRKRKEPLDVSHNGDRITHKHARLRSDSPPSPHAEFPPAVPRALPARRSPEYADGSYVRRANDPRIPAHLVGPHTAEILNLHGVPPRPHSPARDDWSNMWIDAEYERKRKEKNRKDSVPVLPLAGEGVEDVAR